jgi:hypothetical protein
MNKQEAPVPTPADLARIHWELLGIEHEMQVEFADESHPSVEPSEHPPSLS